MTATSTTIASGASGPLVAIKPKVLQPVLDDLSIAPDRARTLGDPPSAHVEGRHAIAGIPADATAIERLAPELLAFARTETSDDGALFVFCLGERTDAELAKLRNALWPEWHAGAIYATSNHQVTRIALDGRRDLGRGCGQRGKLLALRRRAIVMAPVATAEKFDKNAAGWNGNPGSPGYAHFRWMRWFVARMADVESARRILDFGCGAGWVGIEAVLGARGAGRNAAAEPELCAFDPSPAMVELATENARASGIARFTGRVGFGESPPFPAAGEARFDVVISSGVISFAPDAERWLDGLASTLERGGTLVIADIHRGSRGMVRRRATRPLLPVREMNARTRDEVRAMLERRGFVFERASGYQLTYPVPELAHWSERRLGGALNPLLLAWNRRAAERDLARGRGDPDRFDSWSMRLRAP